MTGYMQRHWTQFTIIVMISGLIWIVLTALMTPNTTQGLIPAARQGFLAPDFTLQTTSGESVSLASLRGKVVVVNLWATWCAFCKTEMPAFQSVYQSLGASSNVVILAVNSTIQDDRSAVDAFIQQYGLSFPVLLDTSGRVTRLYEVRALPTTFFIDPQGIIQNVTIGGPLTKAMIQSQINALLGKVQ